MKNMNKGIKKVKIGKTEEARQMLELTKIYREYESGKINQKEYFKRIFKLTDRSTWYYELIDRKYQHDKREHDKLKARARRAINQAETEGETIDAEFKAYVDLNVYSNMTAKEAQRLGEVTGSNALYRKYGKSGNEDFNPSKNYHLLEDFKQTGVLVVWEYLVKNNLVGEILNDDQLHAARQAVYKALNTELYQTTKASNNLYIDGWDSNPLENVTSEIKSGRAVEDNKVLSDIFHLLTARQIYAVTAATLGRTDETIARHMMGGMNVYRFTYCKNMDNKKTVCMIEITAFTEKGARSVIAKNKQAKGFLKDGFKLEKIEKTDKEPDIKGSREAVRDLRNRAQRKAFEYLKVHNISYKDLLQVAHDKKYK